eukprot:TRINITY_DN5304_c0_g1_i4.p2 TRINITY_DN5304_c0_g1~~TRINITY_DN5304_c0_g1_i4.p2  ORF type:complete len:109 (+),score=43.35 TRINITY_DN5304_c0_g1_i4:130-456(+)
MCIRDRVEHMTEHIAGIALKSGAASPLNSGSESPQLLSATSCLELENQVLRQELATLRGQVQGKDQQLMECMSELRMARTMIEALTRGGDAVGEDEHEMEQMLDLASQ